MKIAVIGAGVIGLTAASEILDRFHGQVDLTLISHKFSPDTVTDRSGMVFYLLHNDPQETEERYRKWVLTSLRVFQTLFKSPDNAAIGISLVRGYVLWKNPKQDPWWKDIFIGFRRVGLDSAEAKAVCEPSDYAEIWNFGTFTMNPTSLLQWLLGKIKKGGCKIEQRKVSDISELTSSYDMVINCTGLGSCKELAMDSSLYPIRGELVLMRAPWVKHFISSYDSFGCHTSIIPSRGSDVVLGGVGVAGDWNEECDPVTVDDILKRCKALMPSLRGAEVVGGWAGLRPGRDRVRLEACEVPSGSTVVHCYGHSGRGVILSWGCAADIADIVERRLNPK